MSLNENQPVPPISHETHCPVCGEFLNQGNCSVHVDASKAGVEEQSLGIPDAKADNDNSPPQNALLPCPLPIPDALYSCLICRSEYSWSAEDLFWSPNLKAWICRECYDETEHGKSVTSLADEIEIRNTFATPSVGRGPAEQSQPLLSKENSPAVAPSVVEGVEEKRWNVDAHIFYTRIMQGDTCVTVINGVHNEGCAKQICSAHNASLGEPREKEDLRGKEPSSAMVSVLQNAPALHSANIWHAAKQLAQYRDLQLYNFLNVAVGFLNELAVKIILSSPSNAVLPPPASEKQ